MPTTHALDDLTATPHATCFDGAEPRTIRLALDAGESVDAHRHPGRTVVLYVIAGALDLTLGEETHRLEGGEVIRFDGDQSIAPTAHEASTALVVLSPTPE